MQRRNSAGLILLRCKVNFSCLPFALLLMTASSSTIGQSLEEKFKTLFSEPKHYFCFKTDRSILCDGILNEEAWEKAPWTDFFQDIVGDSKPMPYYKTRAKMTWDFDALYIAAELEEENIWAYLDHHDDIVFRENDFEIFISNTSDSQHYYEIEINALKTIFDLFMTKAYRDGGRAMIEWNVKGIESGVTLDGSINNGSDTDKRWIVEMKLPFKSLSLDGTGVSPNLNDTWRINFSRVQYGINFKEGRYQKIIDSQTGKTLPEHNWVWSPQGVVNMHYPERWGYLIFLGEPVAANTDMVFQYSLEEKMKRQLWLLYYQQKEVLAANKKYAGTLKQLGIKSKNLDIDGCLATLSLKSTDQTFIAKISCAEKGISFSLNNTGQLITYK
jgi:Carbohydrate family 9 binding domain-like